MQLHLVQLAQEGSRRWPQRSLCELVPREEQVQECGECLP